MKIISNTIITIITIISVIFSSCENDSGIETQEPILKIIESDVIFETTGGDGYIIVEAPENITASSNEEWLKINDVSGTKINITAEPNKGMGGRTATITIKSSGELLDVTAVQTAAVVWFKDFRDNTIAFLSEGNTIETKVTSSYPIVVEDKPDWISYIFENDSLYLTALPSAPRKGSITFLSEGRSLTYNIVQVSYSGFLGEWEMEFTNPSSSNRLETTTVFLEEKEKDSSFWLKNLLITGSELAEIAVDFNPNSNNVTISARQYLMTASDGRNVFLCLRSDRGTYSYSVNSQLEGTLDIAEDGTVTYIFGQNGTWPDANGIGFYLFTGDIENPVATGSSYRRLMNIKMTKK